jgi:type VI secretion system protein ImpM
MSSSRAGAQASFAAGWYGKIPVTGDFIARRVPSNFSEAWGRWLQGAITGSRERLGARWRDAFLSMPIWRFVLSPGMLTANAWAGIMAPSVDSIGRYFPLAMASALPAEGLDLVGTLLAADAWFAQLERIALSAIAPAADSANIDAAVVQQRFRTEWLRHPAGRDDTVPMRSAKPQMLCVALAGSAGEAGGALRALAERLVEPAGIWFASECEVFSPCVLLCEALAAPEQYCAMMDGRWIEHGWGQSRVLAAAAG